MKRKLLILSLLFVGFVLWVQPGNAQISDEKHDGISLKMQNATAEEIFAQIEKQVNEQFVYMADQSFPNTRISVNWSNQALNEVLDELGNKLNVDFKITNSGILVKERAQKEQQQTERKISGTVKDDNGEPIPGANIYVKGGNRGTISDAEGNFSLVVPGNVSNVTISSVSFENQTISIANKNNISIVMKEQVSEVEEVIVTGYGTESKRNVTASIATIDPSDVTSIPKSNVLEMLEGRLAGVQVLTDNAPGGGNALRVRGFSTVYYNDPLVVIDGVPISNGLNTINPSDIESINILKDAASASIYGSRAANGVIVITTKKGNGGEYLNFSFEPYFGIQSAYNLPRMLNAQQYGDCLWQAYENDDQTPSDDIYGSDPEGAIIPDYLDDDETILSDDVDWVKEIMQKAKVQSYNLTVNKGDENSSGSISLGYFNQDGLIKYTGFDRYSARINSLYKFGDFLKFGEYLSGSYSEKVSVNTKTALSSLVYSAMQFPSIVPVYDINGDYAGNPINDLANPLGTLYRNKDNKGKYINTVGNVYASLHVKGFTYKSSFGIDYQNYNLRSFSPEYDEILSSNATNSLSQTSSFNYQWTWTNTLNYKKYFRGHNFNLLLGQEAIKYYYEYMTASREDYMYEDQSFWYLDYGDSDNQLNEGSATSWSLSSYFGKLNYNYDERYLATFTLRYDGSSRFADGNKWALFPAFSAGWRLDREDFFDFGDAFSSCLVRASYGQTGNQEIDEYSTVDSYTSVSEYSNYDITGSNTSVSTGLTQTRVANGDLKWETTTQTSIGVDLGLLKNKLKLTAEFYKKVTDDILVEASTPMTYGGSNDTYWTNGGSMKNVGYDITASYTDNLSDFHYNIGVNFSAYKNEMTALSDNDYLGISSSSLHSVNFDQEISRTSVGQPIGSFYGYVAEGLFKSQEEINEYGLQPDAQPGDLKFKDVDNDGDLDEDDQDFIGSPHPDFSYGINLNLEYKRIDLAMAFNGAVGNELYNLTKYKLNFFNQSAYNKSSDVLNAWTEENPDAEIPRLSLDDENNNIRVSSYYVEDGSYLKLNNLQLGYTVNPTLLFNKHLRVYAQLTNVFTITKYEGITPEIGLQNYSSTNGNLDIGIDRGLYPPSRTFTLGCSLKF